MGRHGWLYQNGALAEYTLAEPNGLVRLPEGVTPAQAAALGTVGLTAYQSLEPYIKPNDRVFINGGSGGVGTCTIQIAKLLGASHVTVSCSAANAQLCRDLGADDVVDYRNLNLIDELKKRTSSEEAFFDHIVDNTSVVSQLYEASTHYLKEGGVFVQVAATADSLAGFWSMITRYVRSSWLGGMKRPWNVMLAKNDPKALRRLAEWVQGGKLKVVIDTEYSFSQVEQAFLRLKTGRARGKIVVHVTEDN